MSKRPPKRRESSQLSLEQFFLKRQHIETEGGQCEVERGSDITLRELNLTECAVQPTDLAAGCSSCELVPVGSSMPASATMAFNDIGIFVESGSLPLSSEQNIRVILEHFVPSDDFHFPKVDMNGRKRSFRNSWLSTYPWLVYSKSADGGYCLPCVLFSPSTAANRGVLVKSPFRRWTKVSEVCRGNETKKYHLEAQVAYDAFKHCMSQPEKTIAAQLDNRRAALIEKNRELIKSVAKTVYLHMWQAGHFPSWTSRR
jgi:hypothetical protein